MRNGAPLCCPPCAVCAKAHRSDAEGDACSRVGGGVGWTASSLKRCGHANYLKKLKPKPGADQQAAMDKGTAFHSAVELWAASGRPPTVELTDDDVRGWVELVATVWAPPPGIVLEEAVGLGPTCDYVPVMEKPIGSHVYVSERIPLMTAGRVDWYALDGHGILWVCDWKTGIWAPEHPSTNLQVWAGALAIVGKLMSEGHRVDWVRTGIGYPRDGAFDWSDPVMVGGEELVERWEDVCAAAGRDESPVPGENCAGCWEKRNCNHAKEAA